MAESGNPRRAEAAQTFRCPQGKLPDQGPLATVSPAPDPACDWLQLGADVDGPLCLGEGPAQVRNLTM